ncbi:hypothetical protein [uncultured Rikenella sp.]|uniref:hypothetical protein n=1 Tax=uncultured Rikenella sp. TaxID=368003 RepID=UPI00260BEDF8|nr:hypothetical protein [uncultured Rikenella sp.]
MNGTFPYYSDGVAGEKYTNGNFKATNGRLYKVSTSGAGTPLAWYPAPGYRYHTSGELVSGGRSGYSWSSSFSGTSGVFLYFNTQSLNPSNVSSRGHGLQLRCRAESGRRSSGRGCQ